jgi:hypothetical protein
MGKKKEIGQLKGEFSVLENKALKRLFVTKGAE